MQAVSDDLTKLQNAERPAQASSKAETEDFAKFKQKHDTDIEYVKTKADHLATENDQIKTQLA